MTAHRSTAGRLYGLQCEYVRAFLGGPSWPTGTGA